METEIINSKDENAVISAVNILKKGGLIIYPTETCYGIGADATNLRAVRKLIRLKGRESGKFVPIIISDTKMAEKYLVLNDDIRKLMKKFMPGPLTLVAKKEKMKTRRLLGGFRIPFNRFAINLVKRFGKPVTATSANITGNKPIYRISKIKKVFLGKVDLIIDAGNLPKRQPSTVFDVNSRKVLRKGKISRKEIFGVLGD